MVKFLVQNHFSVVGVRDVTFGMQMVEATSMSASGCAVSIEGVAPRFDPKLLTKLGVGAHSSPVITVMADPNYCRSTGVE